MQHTTPCADCPFRRTVTPGALGGSSPLTYIGQANGPFLLPCHSHCDFDDPEWKNKAHEVNQCAGAAIYRTNVGIEVSKALLSLPVNKEEVFATPEEFLAHHGGISLKKAEEFLRDCPPAFITEVELKRSGIQIHLKEVKHDTDGGDSVPPSRTGQ